MRIGIILTAAIAATLPAWGYESDDIAAIVATSPEMREASAAYKAASAQSSTTNNLNDPEVEFEHQWGARGIGNKWGVSVSQGFDWPGLYRSRSREASAARWAGLSLYETKRDELTLRVELMMINLCYVNKEIALLDSVMNSLENLEEKYRRGFEQGETSILDVKKIELEIIGVKSDYNELLDRREEIGGQLRGINPDADWERLLAIDDYRDEGAIKSEADYAEALRLNNPQSRYLADMRTLAQQSYETTKMSNMPGFSVGYRHDYELGEKFNGITVGMTLPFFSGRNKAKAASLETEIYATAIEAQQERLDAEWVSLRQRAVRLTAECREYQTALASADSQRLLKMALDGGEINLLTYLQESAYFQQARRGYLATEHQMHAVMAQLNRYIGK